MTVRLLNFRFQIGDFRLAGKLIRNPQSAICNSLITAITLIAIFAPTANAQGPYGNEWINTLQKYYKVRTFQTGLYRITADQSAAAGVTSSSSFIDQRSIQVFHNGQEQYIYIYDANGNNRWDSGDYLEFFGQRNDGSLDATMYLDPTMQPNPYYSLFTDTACYYITANASFSNRRMSIPPVDTNYTSSPAPYFIKESYAELPQGYNYGWAGTYYPQGSGLGSSDHEYDDGEGWVGGQFAWGSVTDVPLSTQDIYSSGPNAVFQGTVVGTGGTGSLVNQEGHHIRIRITSPSYDILDTGYEDYRQINLYESFPVSNLNSSSSTIEYSVTQNPAINALQDPTNTDFNSIGYARLTYPHTFQMENASTFKMWIPDCTGCTGGVAFLDMTQFNLAGSSTVALWDTTDHKLIYVSVYGSELKANVPNNNSANPKFCYLAADGAVNLIPASNISPVSHTLNNSVSFTNFLGNPMDSAYIIITSQTLWTGASQYQAYRNQTTNHRALPLVDVDELYDQFAYGIQKHPLSIRNFAHFILDKWTAAPNNKLPPQAMLLLGKGLASEDFRQNASYFNECDVPSYGEPCSDILLTSGLSGTFLEPAIPTGRIAAQTEQNVTDYLTKVEQYEDTQALSPAPFWMKEVLHFGGGDGAQEQAQFDGYLDGYANIISAASYGAHVDSFYSNSSQIATLAQSTVLHQLINGGTSILTFFGHGSTVTFDQDIGEPTIYNNTGRYPILIANSCFAGDIFGTEDTKSEDFIFTAQKGSIAYLASTTIGYDTYLNSYTNDLYTNIDTRMYGKPIGAIIKQTIQNDENTDPLTKQTCYEMTLHGDPLIHPNAWPMPDFSISPSDISFTPSNISTDLDTFSIHALIKNVGKATTDSFRVYIKRQYPDGTDSVFSVKVRNVYNELPLSFKMRTSSFKAAGLNTFTITLNIPDSVNEMTYVNNVATVTLFITSDDIIPVYPPQYAIIPYSTVTLKASTANPFAPAQNYVFEIDTTGNFNSPPSPYHKTVIIYSAGGVLQWANNIQTLQDSPIVYFWRVANDSLITQNDTIHFHWHPSSFTYIPNKTGWSQAHPDQFDLDGYNDVVYNRSFTNDFTFLTTHDQLICTTYGNPVNQNQIDETGYTINGSQSAGEYSACGGTGGALLMIAVIDSLTLQAWSNNGVNYGQYNQYPLQNCRARPENYFEFRFNVPSDMTSAANFLNNIVPVNDYVLVYTYTNTDLSQYPALISALDSLGSTVINTLHDVPYIFFSKKGIKSPIAENYGHSPSDTIAISALMLANWTYGTITSTQIGPASAWTALHWQSTGADLASPHDTLSLSIIGINNAGNAVTLRSGMLRTTTDTTLAWINAATYPNLQLVAYLKDDSTHVPPQLKKWQIYYKELPEAAINPSRLFTFHAPTMAEGDTVKMSVAFDNISDLPMDSLNVIFYLYDKNRVEHNISSVKLDSLRVGKSVTANVAFSSLGYSGNDNLWVEANPYNAFHQPEQLHFNNLGEVNFNVTKDVINPVLDVTFDGVHILNNDIVSAKPDIVIQLHDENKFLALNDTSKFRIYIATPTVPLQQIYFTNSATNTTIMKFTPAVLPNNSCRIDYNPAFTQDGTYQLQVEATDISLNESGANNYAINFDVVNKSSITDVMNYPNPFSTSTRFVFTLTGSVIPTHFRIRIMTASGKVVREIMLSELGPLHIGRNITDYAWNGKDQYGDQLANGIYLYQVTTDIAGQTIDHMSTEADSYFKKGWGKMYLLR